MHVQIADAGRLLMAVLGFKMHVISVPLMQSSGAEQAQQGRGNDCASSSSSSSSSAEQRCRVAHVVGNSNSSSSSSSSSRTGGNNNAFLSNENRTVCFHTLGLQPLSHKGGYSSHSPVYSNAVSAAAWGWQQLRWPWVGGQQDGTLEQQRQLQRQGGQRWGVHASEGTTAPKPLVFLHGVGCGVLLYVEMLILLVATGR